MYSDRCYQLWAADDLLECLLTANASEGYTPEETFPKLLEHLEFRRIHGTFVSLRSPERIRQLRDLKAAMHRVVEFVYGEVSRA